MQVQSLQILEQENRSQSEELEKVVKRGEELLEKVQDVLGNIATHMIKSSID